jgi:hypothetical protein
LIGFVAFAYLAVLGWHGSVDIPDILVYVFIALAIGCAGALIPLMRKIEAKSEAPPLPTGPTGGSFSGDGHEKRITVKWMSYGIPESKHFTKTPFTIGAGRDKDVVIEDTKVDLEHARVVFKDGKHRLVNLAKGGSVLNGARLDKNYPEAEMEMTNTLKIGNTFLEIQIL